MSVKLISYDLGQPESSSDYKKLIEYIKDLGGWAKPLESVWLVDTGKQCSTIRDEAETLLDKNDKFLVIPCSMNTWASYRLPGDVIKWMKNR